MRRRGEGFLEWLLVFGEWREDVGAGVFIYTKGDGGSSYKGQSKGQGLESYGGSFRVRA